VAGFTVWWCQGAVLACRNVPLVPVANDGRISIVASYPKIQISRCTFFFARLASASVKTFWEISVSISDGILLTRTSVTGQQNINIQTQIKYKVIVSQVSVVMSQVAHRKCWKRGFARGQVASGKWFLQESLPIPNFLKCIKNNFFFQETSSFWLLENAKNPTDLKPYWSRAGLRHPYICLFWITICFRWFVYFYICLLEIPMNLSNQQLVTNIRFNQLRADPHSAAGGSFVRQTHIWLWINTYTYHF